MTSTSNVHASSPTGDQGAYCGVINPSTVTLSLARPLTSRSFQGQIMYRANGSALLISGDVTDPEVISRLSDLHDIAYELCDVTMTCGVNANANNNNISCESIPKIPRFLTFFEYPAAGCRQQERGKAEVKTGSESECVKIYVTSMYGKFRTVTLYLLFYRKVPYFWLKLHFRQGLWFIYFRK